MKKKSCQWSNENMQQAIDSYNKKMYGFNELQKEYQNRYLEDILKI